MHCSCINWRTSILIWLRHTYHLAISHNLISWNGPYLFKQVAAEAIKTFIAAIHSIVVQQTEERQLKKKSDNMESKFQSQLEKHSESAMQNSAQPPNKNHSSVSKNDMKLDAFRKQVELEKARYLTSVRTSRAMTLNNLQTSLPNVFHALTGFSGVCMQAFEGISRCSEVTVSHSGAVSPAICAWTLLGWLWLFIVSRKSINLLRVNTLPFKFLELL